MDDCGLGVVTRELTGSNMQAARRQNSYINHNNAALKATDLHQATDA